MPLVPIKRLDQVVVNRIAAGEIINRPSNAIKELIENALDAKSTQIQIIAKEGGLKLLQIQDNGHGIRREDLTIVCERFTTSKLSKIDDLSTIATYGFRGEALASISHIAHVTITTKTADGPCAFRATYSDGKLVPPRPGQSADPKPCAGNNGTQISAEDLFYNMPTRRRAFRSPSDEYNRLLDVVSRYAVHNNGVSFSCKKYGTTIADVQTSSSASTTDTIRQLYGGSVAAELLYTEQQWDHLECSMKTYVTNANYSVNRLNLLLFINHRLVDSPSVKRMIESVYNPLLPKGGHPFVYMSLEMAPHNVDVNIHPSKSEVHFLYEDRIVEAAGDALRNLLESANQSRVFYTQTKLPGAPELPDTAEQEEEDRSRSRGKPNVYNYVRTDGRSTTLDTFLSAAPDNTRSLSGRDQGQQQPMEIDDETDTVPDVTPSSTTSQIAMNPRTRVNVRLTSIVNLRKDIKSKEHAGLTVLFANHTFVGCVDDALALVQHETKLYLVNYTMISEALFYQMVLTEFSNFGCISLKTPVDIRHAIKQAIATEKEANRLPDRLLDADTIAEKITTTLISRADMLREYFCLAITEEGYLTDLPMLLRGYTPTMTKLPHFLLRLGTEVDWVHEQPCFESIAEELAILYCAEPLADVEPGNSSHERYRWQVQHLIFPSLKAHFAAPVRLSTTPGCITQLAHLPDLYKIFERC